MPLTLQPFVISSRSAVMRYGKALMFAQGPALQPELAFVHMLHGLHGHLISMLGHCWTFPWVLGLYKLFLGSEWVYTVSLKMRALGTECLGMREFVCFATQAHCVMRNIWCLSALHCRICATSALISFRAHVQTLWYCLCGKMT